MDRVLCSPTKGRMRRHAVCGSALSCFCSLALDQWINETCDRNRYRKPIILLGDVIMKVRNVESVLACSSFIFSSFTSKSMTEPRTVTRGGVSTRSTAEEKPPLKFVGFTLRRRLIEYNSHLQTQPRLSSRIPSQRWYYSDSILIQKKETESRQRQSLSTSPTDTVTIK